MLKQAASVVLDSSKSSTYPRGYASGFDSPAALLAILFEHPVAAFNQVSDGWTIRARADRLPALAGGEKLLRFRNFEGSP